MPYAPDFEYDVFVSYAHVDDTPLPSAEKGWVTTLIAGLSTQLAALLGRRERLAIFADHQLVGHSPLTDQLLRAVDCSATLVLILSPGYLESQWCRREFDSFLKAVGNRSRRIFIVERLPVLRPPAFGEWPGYRFWINDREGKPARVLGTPYPTREERGYWDALNDLANELANEVKRLSTRGPNQSPCPRGPAVLLAEATDDLDAQRALVRRTIQQAGFVVLPPEDLPGDGERVRAILSECLQQSLLFVQLLGPSSGKHPKDVPEGKVRLQYELAQKLAKPILQWRDPALILDHIDDPAHKELLTVETVRAESIVEFAQAVIDSLRRLIADSTKGETRKSNRVIFVDTACDPDRQQAQEIFGALSAGDAAYMWPRVERARWRQMVDDAHGVLVLWGNDGDWALSRWLECRKRWKARKRRNLEPIAIYDAPAPNKDNKEKLPASGVEVIPGRNGPDEAALNAYLNKVLA